VFFSPITRSWELARGALLASAEIGSQRLLDTMLGTPVRGQWPQPFAVDIRDLVAGLGFGALIASIGLVRDSWSYPSWITVLPTGARRFCSAQAIVRGSPGPRDATTRVDGRSVALAAAGRRRRSGRQRGARGLCSDPTRAVR